MILETLLWIAIIFVGALCVSACVAVGNSQSDTGSVSLAATMILCLPGGITGLIFLVNLLFQGRPGNWTPGSQLLVGLGTDFGTPLVGAAVLLCIIAGLRPGVPREIKEAHWKVVGAGTACMRTPTVVDF
jgi:hypothetical protein